MKLIDALRKVVKTKENTDDPDIDKFCSVAGISSYDVSYTEFTKHLKAYWLRCWLCTDTYVGIQAIYLDDELVAYTEQTARKNPYDVFFIGKAEADKTINFIRSIMESDDNNIASPEDLDGELQTTFNDFYDLRREDYNGFYQNRPVTVIDTFKSVNDQHYRDMIRFKFDDTQEIGTCKISEYSFPLRVTKD